MADRLGGWIQTYTGRRFWPMDPRAEDIDIVDIAHALSLKCRYGGHCSRFYSVAEHSVILANYVEPKYMLWALLHDAAEAYLADVPKPVKPHLVGWQEIEAGVMRAVCKKFNLHPVEPAEVKAADFAILADEKEALMLDGEEWDLPPKLGVIINGWSPKNAEIMFMRTFSLLRWRAGY